MSQLVYDATNADLEEPDWGMFITLCDNVNQRDDAYRQEIITALDSRLKSRSPKTVSHAITLLDTLEKNCFGPFHRLVCQKEFLDNLFRIAMKEQSPENWKKAADLIQCLALSFASVGKEFKLFGVLYRTLRNRGVEFQNEESVDLFTPNLSDEIVDNSTPNMHVRYTSPNAKLENDLHIVQRHMMKMQSLIVKRNRRGNIPENKQRELDDEDDFLSQCLIRLLEVTRCFDSLNIPETTRDLCKLLKNSIVQLLQANKDTSMDASKIQIYPEDMRRAEELEESEESDEDFFNWSVCSKWDWKGKENRMGVKI
ncbi:uncharacterized protein [Blastocystis hominis]|uniref:VHS domain-containing protein n=1 Tax=Blastocystis hominis TaxID=12968 RepID=D8M276_BLAHO|nr:uncharacterized protein [Blastocystis hominis]CBK22165.2 unnamed protein product [Blastocystis hominis]|eukprot:XP_012896213.1 uncharacterized protein [Blastocystis hominis]